MMNTFSYNIIIAGLGGQGVNTLTQTVFELCHAEGLQFQGAIFKGGAQKAGSIRSEIKIFTAPDADSGHHSSQILDGSLHLMLGLEPYEALRYARFFGPETRIVVERASTPFYSERMSGSRPPDAVHALEQRYRTVIAKDFSEIARREYGDRRACNLLMLMAGAESAGFPIDCEAIRALLGSPSAVPAP
jgi:indolepyruvate ferredoxin oxidoreductase, beta subunit